MRKINKVGEELISFYQELRNGYPDLVKKSLVNSLQQMLKSDVIDLGIFELVKDEKVDRDSFIAVLLENKRYIKSQEELLKESEAVREGLNNLLSAENLTALTTESNVEEDEIYVCKTFTIDKDFVVNYFGVGESEIPQLMSRKGFVETFIALRLVKVLGDVIREGLRTVAKIKLGNSLAYLDESENRYHIDLVMRVRIDDMTNEEARAEVLKDIKAVEAISERIYRQKMIY